MILLAFLVVIVIGIAVGVIMGLTGAGGGMLAVPSLIYTQHWTMQQASPVALLAVSSGAFIGAVDGFRRGQVRYKAASLMALIGAPMTSLGVWVAQGLSQIVLMLAFSAVLVIASLRLWRQASRSWSPSCQPSQSGELETNEHALAHVNRLTGRFDWNWKTAGVISLIGACAGFATGALGVGGGFIIVPLLRHYTNLSMQSAAATSLMVISLVGSVAVISALYQGVQLPTEIAIYFALSSIVGVWLGRHWARHIAAHRVQKFFAIMLFAVACSLVWKALIGV